MDPATGNQSQTKPSKKRWKKAKNQPKKWGVRNLKMAT
jgi:hypothetical protein